MLLSTGGLAAWLGGGVFEGLLPPHPRPLSPCGSEGGIELSAGSLGPLNSRLCVSHCAAEHWGLGEAGTGSRSASDGSQDGCGALAHGGAIDRDGSAAGKSLRFSAGDIQATARIRELVVERGGQVAVSE